MAKTNRRQRGLATALGIAALLVSGAIDAADLTLALPTPSQAPRAFTLEDARPPKQREPDRIEGKKPKQFSERALTATLGKLLDEVSRQLAGASATPGKSS